jgi:hypothetical protein
MPLTCCQIRVWMGTTLSKRSRLSTALLELLQNDPEWTAYVADLSPTTPLRRAVEDYLRFVRERVALTEEEVAFADQILAMMVERGYRTAEGVAEAIESNDVSLAELMARLQGSPRRLEPGGA